MTLRVSWLTTAPPWLLTCATLACNAPSLMISPWLLCSAAAVNWVLPLVSRRPLLRLSTVLAVMSRAFLALMTPPWLSTVWLALTVAVRLATTLALLRISRASRLTSPVVVRVLSGFTPASMMPLLVNCPPLLRRTVSRAARLFWVFRSPLVFTVRAVPA